MYLDCVLLWPDDGCFIAETCRLEVNENIFYIIEDIVVFLDGNKYHFTKDYCLICVVNLIKCEVTTCLSFFNFNTSKKRQKILRFHDVNVHIVITRLVNSYLYFRETQPNHLTTLTRDLLYNLALNNLYICIPTNCTQLIYFINNTLKHMYCLKL